MIGLVLAGGGVRGSYEIGAYYAFKECNIKFDGYVGTSIGSLNAAFLAAQKDQEILDLWVNADIPHVLGLDDDYAKFLNKSKISTNILQHLILNGKEIIENKGLSNDNLEEVLEKANLEQEIRKNNLDYGLVTVKVKDDSEELEPIYVFKEDIPNGKLNEYILASCHFPIFKQEKTIDNNYYIDGGFYDNAPANMLLDKGYDKVYIIDLSAIGVRRRIKDIHKTVIIEPSHNLKSIMNTNKTDIINNIKLGYYDTLKILKNLDGNKFIFKNVSPEKYESLITNVNPELLDEMKERFFYEDSKKLILDVIEYLMLLYGYDYMKIYDPLEIINEIRQSNINTNVFEFIRELNI